jgi:uracil-DNA glycosylase family 4
MARLGQLNKTIVGCMRCPRLVQWRKQVAEKPPRRYQGMTYWAKPLSGFGDPKAKLLIVGLAPAAHGGNRTGRIFTGDRSGDWLYEALHTFGFSNHPTSIGRNDGLSVKGCYITAAVRCAPPANKPTTEEFENCRPYLIQELKLFRHIRVVVALGKLAFDSFLRAYEENGGSVPKPRPQFRHGGSSRMMPDLTLLASYHPSQQNTFTGKLTRKMFHSVLMKAKELVRSL